MCQGQKLIKTIEDKIISEANSLKKKRKKKITINQEKQINPIMTICSIWNSSDERYLNKIKTDIQN